MVKPETGSESLEIAVVTFWKSIESSGAYVTHYARDCSHNEMRENKQHFPKQYIHAQTQ